MFCDLCSLQEAEDEAGQVVAGCGGVVDTHKSIRDLCSMQQQAKTTDIH